MSLRGSSGRVDNRFLIALLVILPVFLVLCQMSIDKGAFYSLSILFGLIVCLVTLFKTEWALVILIFATLLSPELDIGEAAGRAVTIRIEDILLLVILFTWLAKMAIIKELGFIKKTELNTAIWIYSIFCVFATVVGVLRGNVNPVKGTFFVLKYLEYFVLFFLVVNNINKKKHVHLLLWSFFLVCLIITVYSMTKIGSVYRLSAPFEGEAGEPNTFGAYLLFLFSLSVGILLYVPNIKQRLFFIALAICTSIALMFTLSRGSYLGLTVSFTVFLFITRYKRILLLLGALSAVIVLFLMPGAVQNRVLYTFSLWEPQVTEQSVRIFNIYFDPSSSARIESWKVALQDWVERPFLGFGVSGRGLVDNQYLTVLSESGILGLLAFLFLLWKLYSLSYSSVHITKSRFYQGLFLGYFAGYVGLLVHAFTANTFILIRVMEPFWFLTALMVVLPNILKEEEENERLLAESKAA